MKRRTFLSDAPAALVCALLILLCVFPFLYVLLESFLDDGSFALSNYYAVFFASDEYLLRFWKSMGLSCAITLGQVAVSALAGFGFARYRFRGKRLLFVLLIGTMILPLQVTLVPNYFVLNQLGLLNTYYSLILPSIFAPLGTFLMTRSFQKVDSEILDSAMVDGCGTLRSLFLVTLPMVKGNLICVGLLAFLDAWNMVEQPISFLNSFDDYPLSVALTTADSATLGQQTVCCVLALLPPLLAFAYFGRELTDGIAEGGAR